MVTNVKRLNEGDMEQILNVEKKAFIPSIQTTEEIIKRRLSKGHIYFGVDVNGKLVGTLALRFAQFKPNFADFVRRNPTFYDYAESDNEQDANAGFAYSLGIVPEHRNAINAVRLIQEAVNIGENKGMEFLVSDARVPSYNGSNKDDTEYEHFDRNDTVHKAIDAYFKTGILPTKKLIEQDPVAGFYLKVFPEAKVLGITDEKFWQGDEPCGGHMVIEYLRLKEGKNGKH